MLGKRGDPARTQCANGRIGEQKVVRDVSHHLGFARGRDGEAPRSRLQFDASDRAALVRLDVGPPGETVRARMRPAHVGSIARARESLPPDLYQQPAYLIVRPFWSFLGRVYRVYAEDGRLAFFVRHPFFRVREQLILFADEEETIPVLEIRNRSLISFNMCHDVLDALTGVRLGSVRTRGLSWMWR